jgi:phosphoribosyl 1,2-cyclic phosphodiesterase
VHVKLWGVRGSVPVPGAAAAGFGGNTSCVQVLTDAGGALILDAGTGIRELSATLAGTPGPIHILVTHLHLDHIVGLGFFEPFFDAGADVTVWGPPDPSGTLRERVSRYISDPLSPLEIKALPAHVTFADVPRGPWRIGDVEVRAEFVAHRGPTLGYRLQADGASVCYLPDHEPADGQDVARADSASLSGYELARGASLLIHDCQYADEEYPARRGWGHSCVSDALRYARRCHAGHVVLFHHDPWHDDSQLEAMWQQVQVGWPRIGGTAPIEMAREGHTIVLAR